MSSLEILPPDVRRSLARAEMRRRGLRLKRPDDGPSLYAPLKAGLATIDPGKDFDLAVLALAGRVTAGTLTPADRALLDSLPPCDAVPALDYVRALADVLQEY